MRLVAGPVLILSLLALPARAEILLPPGFTAELYVSGRGFDRLGEGGPGIPVTTTLAVGPAGALYLAKSGNRYLQTDAERYLTPLYRIPPGGARLTAGTEERYVHGPPLRNPEVGAVGPRGELWVTTYDPDRRIGVLYRMVDGRPTLFGGGTPPAGRPPVLEQAEGVVIDPDGSAFVADRARGVVVRLHADGRLRDARYRDLAVERARMLARDTTGALWVAGDGGASQPWQDASGEIWRVGPDSRAARVFHGPHAADIAPVPGGTLLVAQRHAARIFLLGPDGRRVDFARFTDHDFPRAMAVSPAGELYVVVSRLRTWWLNEVFRVTGPLAEFARQAFRPPS